MRVLFVTDSRDAMVGPERAAERFVVLPLYAHLTPNKHSENILTILSDSGHGGQEKDTDGDEADGYDECELHTP